MKDIAASAAAPAPTGYTALPSMETAGAERAREMRAAQLQRQPEPETDRQSRSTQAAAGKVFFDCVYTHVCVCVCVCVCVFFSYCLSVSAERAAELLGGGANKSSIGFEMDDRTAEALGFVPR